MKRHNTPADDSWESDAVWKLVDQATPRQAGPRFVDDTVRAARLASQASPWWSLMLRPAPLAGLAAAAAALVFSIVSLFPPAESDVGTTPIVTVNHERAAEIQEIAETETLLAAVENLDDFSDTELVSLIGF